ncbi:MAG: cytochrome c [Candidatus Anammoxibacter sp.]
MGNFNVKLFSLMAFSVLFIAISVQPAIAKKKEFGYKDEKEVSHTMRMLQMNTENLHIAFEKQDWKQLGKLALKIHDACTRLETRGNMDIPVEFDDFRLFSENLHDYAEAIVKASKEQDIDKAKVAYKEMEKTCVDCHKIFR